MNYASRSICLHKLSVLGVFGWQYSYTDIAMLANISRIAKASESIALNPGHCNQGNFRSGINLKPFPLDTDTQLQVWRDFPHSQPGGVSLFVRHCRFMALLSIKGVNRYKLPPGNAFKLLRNRRRKGSVIKNPVNKILSFTL